MFTVADGHAHAGRGDGGADSAPALQPSFQLQLFKCLAQCGPRDTETGRELTLVGQDLAHGELGVERVAEHGLQVPVLRFRHRFELRGPHPDPPQRLCALLY
ncbi:hypothetical protein GCM10020000_09410 [Streptomyces olivoverticillatus]